MFSSMLIFLSRLAIPHSGFCSLLSPEAAVVTVETASGRARITRFYHGLPELRRRAAGKNQALIHADRRTVRRTEQLEAGQVYVGHGPEIHVHLIGVDECLDQKHSQFFRLTHGKTSLQRYVPLISRLLKLKDKVHDNLSD
jgi:hypothetical protein